MSKAMSAKAIEMSDCKHEKGLGYEGECVPCLKAQLAEHEYRWKWLNRSILEISKEGYSEWASVVLAVINKCRYEELQGEGK